MRWLTDVLFEAGLEVGNLTTPHLKTRIPLWLRNQSGKRPQLAYFSASHPRLQIALCIQEHGLCTGQNPFRADDLCLDPILTPFRLRFPGCDSDSARHFNGLHILHVTECRARSRHGRVSNHQGAHLLIQDGSNEPPVRDAFMSAYAGTQSVERMKTTTQCLLRMVCLCGRWIVERLYGGDCIRAAQSGSHVC